MLALAVLAVSATATGLVSLSGKPGIGVAALTMVLVGNPWSGVTSAPELLPEPAGTMIGQLLPPGAAGTLLRSVAYFDGAAVIGPLTVLLVWAVAGLTAVAMRARRAS